MANDKGPAARYPRQVDPERIRRAGVALEDDRLAGDGIAWKKGQLTIDATVMARIVALEKSVKALENGS